MHSGKDYSAGSLSDPDPEGEFGHFGYFLNLKT